MMNELRARQEDLSRLNTELEDTNRGVVALYAELDEKAERLRRADQMKSRFLSHMSHEFRTPLTSILALSRLLHGRRGRQAAAGAAEAGDVHPQIGGEPARDGERSARPGARGGRQIGGASGALSGGEPVRRAARRAAAAAGERSAWS